MGSLRVAEPMLVPQAQGRKVLVVKSHKDTRYHAHQVVTHDGISRVGNQTHAH